MDARMVLGGTLVGLLAINCHLVPACESHNPVPKVPEPEKGYATNVGKYQREQGPPERPTTPPLVQVVMGAVDRSEASSLRIRDSTNGEHDLKIDGRTVVIRDRQPISIEEVKPGADVSASYIVEGSTKVATRVDVLKPTPPRPQ